MRGAGHSRAFHARPRRRLPHHDFSGRMIARHDEDFTMFRHDYDFTYDADAFRRCSPGRHWPAHDGIGWARPFLFRSSARRFPGDSITLYASATAAIRRSHVANIAHGATPHRHLASADCLFRLVDAGDFLRLYLCFSMTSR